VLSQIVLHDQRFVSKWEAKTSQYDAMKSLSCWELLLSAVGAKLNKPDIICSQYPSTWTWPVISFLIFGTSRLAFHSSKLQIVQNKGGFLSGETNKRIWLKCLLIGSKPRRFAKEMGKKMTCERALLQLPSMKLRQHGSKKILWETHYVFKHEIQRAGARIGSPSYNGTAQTLTAKITAGRGKYAQCGLV